MRNFDENALFTQGGSALDCFRGERNQKSILDEISAFGDEELNASYQRFFEASESEKDAYLTGKGLVTAQQISLMLETPEPEIQKDILQHSTMEDILFYLSKFRLCLAVEYMLLRRRDLELARFYFEHYALYPTTQEYLVRKALKDEMFFKMFLEYILFRPLEVNARKLLIASENDEIVEAYVARYPFEFVAIDDTCCYRLARIDFMMKHLSRLEDKIALAMVIRKTPKCAKHRKYNWAYDVRAELQQLADCNLSYWGYYLNADEEVFLAGLPQTGLLISYLKHAFLTKKAQEVILRRNEKELATAYFEAQKYRVDGELVEMMIKEDLDQSFVTYAEHIEMTYYLFMLLQRSAHGKIKDLMQKTKMFNHSPKFTR